MKNSFYLLFTGILFFQNTFAQNKNIGNTSQIQWLSIEEAYNRSQKEPKKTIVDVYTDWCGWCKVMDNKTYSNQTIIDYLNKNYYMVKLNAEAKNDISVGGIKYKFDTQKGANEVAIALLQGKLSYPTTVFLDQNFNMIQPIPGYFDSKEFHKIITFLGGDYYKKENFDTFKEGTYKNTFKDALPKL